MKKLTYLYLQNVDNACIVQELRGACIVTLNYFDLGSRDKSYILKALKDVQVPEFIPKSGKSIIDARIINVFVDICTRKTKC